MDMNSGGGIKEPPYEYIFIEADKEGAKVIFYNRFHHNPERVSCTCCGEDYSISSEESLALASAHDRGCKFSREQRQYDLESASISLEHYLSRDNVLAICADDISASERVGDVPEEGYVWV